MRTLPRKAQLKQLNNDMNTLAKTLNYLILLLVSVAVLTKLDRNLENGGLLFGLALSIPTTLALVALRPTGQPWRSRAILANKLAAFLVVALFLGVTINKGFNVEAFSIVCFLAVAWLANVVAITRAIAGVQEKPSTITSMGARIGLTRLLIGICAVVCVVPAFRMLIHPPRHFPLRSDVGYSNAAKEVLHLTSAPVDDADKLRQSLSRGYLAGILEAGNNLGVFCTPPGYELVSAQVAIATYSSLHPQPASSASDPAAWLVEDAMNEAFPCKR